MISNNDVKKMLQKNFKENINLEDSKEHIKEVISMLSYEYAENYSKPVVRKRIGRFMFVQVQKKIFNSIVLQSTILVLFLAIIYRFYEETGYLLSRHLTQGTTILAIVVAFISVPFIGRSKRYNMLEVESVTYVSRSFFTIINLGIILVDNILIIGLAMIFTEYAVLEDLGYNFCYVMLPYLLAGSGCILIQRKCAPESSSFYYAIFGVIMVIAVTGIPHLNPDIYSYERLWIMCTVMVASYFCYQVYQLFRKKSNDYYIY